MKRRFSFPVEINSTLLDALESLNRPNVLIFARIVDKWPNIVGPQLAALSAPGDLKRKVLTVWVAEPVWLDTMLFMEREITLKLNSLFDAPVVSKVKIILKRGFKSAESPNEKTDDNKGSPLSDSEIKEIDSAVAGLPDSQLRSSFKRVMLKDRKLKIKRSQDD